MDLSAFEWPKEADVRPGMGSGQFLVRFPNDYGASIIPDPQRAGAVEMAVVYFPGDEWGGWEYVRSSDVNPYDGIVPGIDDTAVLAGYLDVIGSWEARPWTHTVTYTDDEADSKAGRQEWRLVFTWDVGTPYVHVFWPHADETDTANAFEIINVWNYAEGKCGVSTRAQFRAVCEQFGPGLGGDELANYWDHTA
jgi:hypothetical protein